MDGLHFLVRTSLGTFTSLLHFSTCVYFTDLHSHNGIRWTDESGDLLFGWFRFAEPFHGQQPVLRTRQRSFHRPAFRFKLEIPLQEQLRSNDFTLHLVLPMMHPRHEVLCLAHGTSPSP
jgi:hypothetical protein